MGDNPSQNTQTVQQDHVSQQLNVQQVTCVPANVREPKMTTWQRVPTHRNVHLASIIVTVTQSLWCHTVILGKYATGKKYNYWNSYPKNGANLMTGMLSECHDDIRREIIGMIERNQYLKPGISPNNWWWPNLLHLYDSPIDSMNLCVLKN